jgi:hypothetical protein
VSDLRQSEVLAAVERAALIERDFLTRQGGPILFILSKARAEATEAIAELITVDPAETRAIMALQNEVQRYRDLLKWLAEAISLGNDAVMLIDEEARDDIREALGLAETMDQ